VPSIPGYVRLKWTPVPGAEGYKVFSTKTLETLFTNIPLSVLPSSSSKTGVGDGERGTPITITGTGFVAGAKVEVGQGNGAGPTAIEASNVVVRALRHGCVESLMPSLRDPRSRSP